MFLNQIDYGVLRGFRAAADCRMGGAALALAAPSPFCTGSSSPLPSAPPFSARCCLLALPLPPLSAARTH